MKELHYRQKVYNIIQDIFKTQITNKQLFREMTNELTKKGLNPRILSAIQDKSLKIEDLDDKNDEEKINSFIAITKACYEVLKEAEDYKILNPDEVFEKSDLIDYASFKKTKQIVSEIVLRGVKRIDEFNYEADLSYKDIYDYLSNVLIRYNMKSQRESKVANIGTKGGLTREIDLNKKNKKEIKELALQNKLESTQIILNVRIADVNKKEKFEPERVFKSLKEEMLEKFTFEKDFVKEINNKDSLLGQDLTNLGELTIRPNYDLEADNFTVVEILDGWHRILAIKEAVTEYHMKNNKWLEGTMSVKIVLRTLDDAIEIVRQVFQRADTGKQFLKGLEKNDYTEFIDNLSNSSQVLKGKVTNQWNEYKTNNKLIAYKLPLAEAIEKCTDIEVNKKGISLSTAQQIAQRIDILIETIADKYFNSDLEDMKKNSLLLSSNMFIGYIAIGKMMLDTNSMNYIDIADNLYSISDEDLRKLKITEKNCSVTQIYEYFTKLIGGIISVA